ncbi:MAG TPA: DJ-1/PfpI/YhbO family deglycase/protease [Anaeromyxobacter sp.]|nr:DJ-1/PfpI/YhbO family deglycase/protease [Anaeromyxobacter sp.]
MRVLLRFRSSHVRARGHWVRVLEAGRGPGVLLVASPLVMARTYAPLARRLASAHRTVVLELPGSGLSSRIARPLPFGELGAVAADVVAALGGRWVVIGHSNSGPVAVELAARRPAQVEALVLVDTIGARQAPLRTVVAGRLGDALREPGLTLRGSPHVLWNVLRHLRSFAWHVRAAARPSGLEAGAAVSAPVLVAWGMRDTTMPPACAARVAAALPGARTAFGRGGHDWLITHAAEFASVLERAHGRARDPSGGEAPAAAAPDGMPKVPSMGNALRGVRVAVLAADGFEQVEVTWPLRALRRAGADVRIVSLRPGRIRGLNFIWRGKKLAVDDTVFRARAEDYGALLLPGGFVNPDLLRQSEHARAFVREMDRLGRPIAVICHGPQVLVSAGLVRGRRLTSWMGIADDVRNAGAEWVDAAVVRDGRWLSSRGPQDLAQFSPAAVELFAAHAARDLAPLPRRLRWAATLSRAASLGAAAAAAAGARRAVRGLRARRRSPGQAALRVAQDVGLAAAFGSMLFGKVALDAAVASAPDPADRARVMLAGWRRGAVLTGVGLATACLAWVARRRTAAPSARRAVDWLLGSAVAIGAANSACAEVLARAGAERVPLRTGRTATPDAPAAARRVVRAGAISGFAFAGVVGSAIGAAAAARTA